MEWSSSAIEPTNIPTKKGYIFTGWDTSEYKCVKKALTVKATYVWENTNLPIITEIESAKRNEEATGYDIKVKLTNFPNDFTKGKLVFALITKEGKMVASEIKSISMPETKEISETATILYSGLVSRVQVSMIGVVDDETTGTPKAIVVSHGAASRFIRHFTEIFEITSADVIGNQAPFDFDVSVKDIYSSIMTGAQLVLIPKEYFSTPPRLLDYLCDKKVTNLTWAVSALTLVSALKGLNYRVPESVKRVMFSGEAMPPKQLRIWQEKLPDAKFVNLYGPTEITCNCTYFPIERQYEDSEKIPAGKAFPGRRVILVDEEGKQVTEPGVQGEICSAGESLANGYYKEPEQTAEKFVLYPVDGTEQRMYRTGDLGSYDEEGNIIFAGRKDFQIKHMGHRIELEEIERSMTALDGVEKSCCVFDMEKNRIMGFYLGEKEAADVRKQMKEKLPVYMVPTKLIQVDEMPLNKNGKTDRNYFKNYGKK